MENMTPILDDEFLIDLRDSLVSELDEVQLKALCANQELDYDHLAGQSKADKVATLVATLREYGKIHALIEALRQGASSKAAITVSDVPQVNPKLTRKEKRERRRERRLGHRKRFLQSLFDGEPIALEDELCKSWEFMPTRILHILRPKHVRRKITTLSDNFAGIDFLDDLKQQNMKDSQISDESSGLLLPDKAFVNFHSVRLWYASIRRDTHPPLVLTIFAIGLLLSVLAAYVTGFLLFASGLDTWLPITNESNPGLVYSFQEAGTYFIEVEDPTSRGHDYWIGVFNTSGELLDPNFSQDSIWPISYGDRVLSELRWGEQHIYRINGSEGDKVAVDVYGLYADSDLNFVLFDSRMNQCDALSLSGLGQMKDTYLECSTTSRVPLYLRVQIVDEPLRIPLFSLSSKYGFRVYKVSDARQKSNDIIESSTPIEPGSVVRNSLSDTGRDYYHFTAQASEELEISAYNLSDSNSSSVTLYRLIEDELLIVDHSTKSTGMENLPYLSTTYGQSYAVAFILQSLGFPAEATDVEQPWLWLYYYPSLVLSVFAFAFYAFFVKFLTLRKYEESHTIKLITDILLKLRDDDALNSESKKASIRTDIKLASDRIRKVHRISRFPPLHASPESMRHHMAKIASQIRQMNEVVSTPAERDLSLLRYKFTEWLSVLLKAEYGRFQLDEDFEMDPIPWHRQFAYSLQHHWKGIGIAVVFFSIAMWLTHRVWRDYTNDIIRFVWQATRYMILIVTSYAIYSRWGAKGPSERQQNKWEHAVRLILFFLVPLFGLDALLQTGIVESIIKLIGLKGIF